MSYQSIYGKRPGEMASKSMHSHIINDPSVKDFLNECHLPPKSGNIKSCFLPLLITDPLFLRTNKIKWQIDWNSGILTITKTGKRIMAFHFQKSKKNVHFLIEEEDPNSKSFKISK